MSESRGYRSLFWPIVLISVGVIWLLGNIGLLGAQNLVVLFRLWPVILIAIGLDLLIGRNSALMGTIIGVGTVVLVIALMLLGPSLGLVQTADVQSANIAEPLDGAESADVTLNLAVGDVDIHVLDDSSNLFAADLTYLGELDFQTSGDRNRTVYLGTRYDGVSVSTWPFESLLPGGNNTDLTWDVGLSPRVAMALSINGGVGDSDIDLTGLNLTDLNIDSGVGRIDIALPAGDYEAEFDGGVGEFEITIAEGANIILETNGGVGEVTINVPDNAAVRVMGDGGLGGLNLPRNMTQTSTVGDNEVWETDGFTSASEQIVIRYNGGIGGLTVR